MEWFYRIGNQFLTILFYFITQLGGSILPIVILGIIYWCFDKEKGERIGFAIITSICLNGVLKSLFNFKRPFKYSGKSHLERLKDSTLSSSSTGSSFPSGHSQNAGVLYASLMQTYKKKWLNIICIIIMILVPISRLYLGVHFPSDVICGLLIGICVSLLCFFILKKFAKQKLMIYFLTTLIFTPFVFIKSVEYDFLRGYGLILGFSIGAFFEQKFINFENPKSTKERIIRLFLGIALVGGFYFLVGLIPDSISHQKFMAILIYGTVSFLTIGVVPFIFKIKLKFKKTGE